MVKPSWRDKWTALFFLPILLLGGCGAPRVCPPAFSLYGYQRVAVIPFDNQTQDPGLASYVQSEMVDQVLQLNALPVIDANLTAAYLRDLKADPASVPTDPALMKKIADHFKADLLLMGTATGYVEILKDGAPFRAEDTGQLGFKTFRKVSVAARAQLLDPNSGSLVWSDKNQGYSWTDTFNPLSVPDGPQLPAVINNFLNLANVVANRVLGKDDWEPAVINENDPTQLLYPKSHYFANLRQKATYEAVNAIVDDFRGHNGWMPGMTAAP
jgi:TolB-like protein